MVIGRWSLAGLVSAALALPLTAQTPPFLYTVAPRFDENAPLTGGERFPSGARLMVSGRTGPRPLVPDFAASADADVSFDGTRVLFAGKRSSADPWQVWEAPLAGGRPRAVTDGRDDCIRPLYAAADRVVYARRTASGTAIEIVAAAGGRPVRLTRTPGRHLPDAVLRDGRILYEAAHPGGTGSARDLFTVYADGSGVETVRCDHGPDRHSAAQSASGDIVFRTGRRFARFTSPRAVEVEWPSPAGDYAGPAAELATGEWLVSYRAPGGKEFNICRVRLGAAAASAPLVRGNAFQPVPLAPRPVPLRHPSALTAETFANLLCLGAYTTRDARLAEGSLTRVRVWSLDDAGRAASLGEAPVETDGSFFVRVPADRPLRFELLDSAGRTVRAERGWFWAGRGEQRVCVGCHAGPERAPDNRAPRILERNHQPTSLGVAAPKEETK